MSERPRNEKDEKGEEKQHEKQQEKSWEEKWRRDRANALVWGAVLVWAGLVLLADVTGYSRQFPWWQGWAIFFIGWGIIILLGVLLRLAVPEYRRPVGGSTVWGMILVAVGLWWLLGWGSIWPVILIIIGLVIVVRAFIGRR